LLFGLCDCNWWRDGIVKECMCLQIEIEKHTFHEVLNQSLVVVWSTVLYILGMSLEGLGAL
jgi:hypothetical protein